MKKHLFLLVASLLLLASTWAWAGAFSAAGKGTTAAQFLKLGAGARSAALGEAYSAVVDEASALYWNPAAINRIGRRSVTFMHATYLNTSALNYAAYAQSLGPASGWGVAIQHFSAGELDQLDDSGGSIGTFNPNDMAITMGYARQLGGISFGMNGKFIQSTIVDSAQAFALDFGVLTPSFMGDRMRLSFTAVNLGTKIKFDQAEEELPMAFRFGSAYKIAGQWSASADLAFPNDNKPYLAFGSELGLPLGDTLSLVGRLGYNSRTDVNKSDKMSGIAFGFGFQFAKLTLDYGFLPFGSVGFVHRISVSRKF